MCNNSLQCTCNKLHYIIFTKLKNIFKYSTNNKKDYGRK